MTSCLIVLDREEQRVIVNSEYSLPLKIEDRKDKRKDIAAKQKYQERAETNRNDLNV